MRRSLTVLALVLAVAVATTAYLRQPAPRSALGDAVGVRRTRTFSPFCRWFVRDTRVGTWPTGAVRCAWYRPVTPSGVAELDQLSYNVLTRRVFRAERSWEPLSDAAWRRDVDSVRAALREQGGVASCVPSILGAATEIREFWRFPGFEILLFTGGDASQSPTNGVRTPRWFLFVHGQTGRLTRGLPGPACLPDR